MNERSTVTLAPDFIERSKRIWEQYQGKHDVKDLRGQVAAIEPDSGKVWIGEEALEAVDKMNADGVDAPVWLVRVGFDFLDIKGRG